LEVGRLPVLACSALEGQGVGEVLEAVVDAYRRWNARWVLGGMTTGEQRLSQQVGDGGMACRLISSSQTSRWVLGAWHAA
jgi:hypothetical protein